MRSALSGLAMPMIASAALAAPEKQSLLFGQGLTSCETALAPGNAANARNWALGYWSGLNVASGVNVGAQTDRAGVLAEIAVLCKVEPSLQLSFAVARVRADLAAKRR